jgi:hypothetical protein
MDLIEKYPELAALVSSDKGYLEIDVNSGDV